MIKHITGSGRYMQVSGGMVMPYISPGAQGAGQVRYNTNINSMEVWDGVTWKELSTHTSVGLTGEAEALLDWARTKRDEEYRLEALAEKYPIIKDLKEQLEVAIALVQN